MKNLVIVLKRRVVRGILAGLLGGGIGLSGATAALAVTPDQPSEPPHCSATTSSEAGTSSRVNWLAYGSICSTASIAASTVFR